MLQTNLKETIKGFDAKQMRQSILQLDWLADFSLQAHTVCMKGLARLLTRKRYVMMEMVHNTAPMCSIIGLLLV